MLALAVTGGAIDPNSAATVELGLGLLASTSGNLVLLAPPFQHRDLAAIVQRNRPNIERPALGMF